MMENDSPHSVQRHIEQITLTRLFGQYDYQIPVSGAECLQDIVILYGDNGCGKTTLLKLVFHALSAAPDRGHRTALSKVPFGELIIALSDGTTVVARRDGGEPESLNFQISIPGQDIVSGCYYRTNEDQRFESERFERDYLNALRNLNLTLYYLADDRELVSDQLDKGPQAIMWETYAHGFLHPRRRYPPEPQPDDLSRTLKMTQEWIGRQLIQGSNAGSENANTIYLEILSRLSEQYATPTASSIERLSELIDNLRSRAVRFSRFGFVAPLNVDGMLEAISKVPNARRETMIAILEPYINGVSARLDSLAQVTETTEKLVDGLTAFFSGGKHVEFDVSQGFRFIDHNGWQLRPEWLSSGEQHLVRLFCCTAIARDTPSVFLVDEPELSLNIKWQRRLIQQLKELSFGSPNQFFFATHSMEILAQHRDRVVHLKMGTEGAK